MYAQVIEFLPKCCTLYMSVGRILGTLQPTSPLRSEALSNNFPRTVVVSCHFYCFEYNHLEVETPKKVMEQRFNGAISFQTSFSCPPFLLQRIAFYDDFRHFNPSNSGEKYITVHVYPTVIFFPRPRSRKQKSEFPEPQFFSRTILRKTIPEHDSILNIIMQIVIIANKVLFSALL